VHGQVPAVYLASERSGEPCSFSALASIALGGRRALDAGPEPPLVTPATAPHRDVHVVVRDLEGMPLRLAASQQLHGHEVGVGQAGLFRVPGRPRADPSENPRRQRVVSPAAAPAQVAARAAMPGRWRRPARAWLGGGTDDALQ